METFFTIFVSNVFKPLAFKMSKLKEIIHQVSLLFLEFGIKSMSMDDLASSLRISKKTLYKYVSDKNDLVYQVMKEIIKIGNDKFQIRKGLHWINKKFFEKQFFSIFNSF